MLTVFIMDVVYWIKVKGVCVLPLLLNLNLGVSRHKLSTNTKHLTEDFKNVCYSIHLEILGNGGG